MRGSKQYIFRCLLLLALLQQVNLHGQLELPDVSFQVRLELVPSHEYKQLADLVKLLQ